MSKRNVTFFILILIAIVLGVLGYFYFSKPTTTGTGDDTGTNFLSQFNPFSNGPTNPPATTTPPPTTTTPTTPVTAPTQNVVNLKKVSSMPIAGYGIFKKERFTDVPVVIPTTPDSPASPVVVTSTTTTPGQAAPTSITTTTTTTTVSSKPTPPPTEFASALRYVARSSGNIYQTFADKIDERKFSSTVIPQVSEAYFGNNGQSVVMRYLKSDDTTIETYVGSIPKEVLGEDNPGNNELTGTFLPENITDVSLSADKTKLFYLLNIGDSIVGTTFGLADNKKAQVFDSPFTEWLSWWPNAKMVTLTTKPSATVPGYMYTVDPTTKKLGSVLLGVNGLTTLASPDGKMVLYGSNDLTLNLYNIATKSATLVGIQTLPEKCVWNSSSTTIYCAVPKAITPAAYPDDWYKGEISFSDQIWKVDVTTGTTTILLDPASIVGVGEIDGIKLGLDDTESYLFFVNKKDSYLWELGLK